MENDDHLLSSRRNCHPPDISTSSSIENYWPECSFRQARQLDFVCQFTSNIQFVHGKHNVVADMLSRPEASAINTGTLTLDFNNIQKAQAEDEELKELIK